MRRQLLATKLRRNERVLGMFNFSGSPNVVEILATAGFDFVVIDTEHTWVDLRHAADLVRAADSYGIAPIIRVHEPNAALILKALDTGAQGVVVPHVNSREDAEAAVRAARYGPRGIRGMCPDVRAAGYSIESWQLYAKEQATQALVIPLIEEQRAVDRIEEIVSVEGIDCVFFGPADYGVSIGAAEQGFTSDIQERTRNALARVCNESKAHGVSVLTTPLVGLDRPGVAVKGIVELGVQGIVYATDTMVFGDAVRRIAAEIRSIA